MAEHEVIEMQNFANSTTYKLECSRNIRNGNSKSLTKYLDYHGTRVILSSCTLEEKRTLLHDVCDCENKKVANEMLDELLTGYDHSEHPENDKFIDKQDFLGNTALHYALQRKNRFAVQQLVCRGADVNLKNNKDEEAVTGIYEQFPKTILFLFDGQNEDKRIEFGKDEDEENDDDDKRKITCDFGAIIGIDVDRRKVYETYMLENILHLNEQTKAKFLRKLLVQIFLDLKWGKLNWLIYISMFFHIIWSIISCHVIWNIFMTKYENRTNTTEEWNQLENKTWKLFADEASQSDFSNEIFILSVCLLLYTGVVVIKEFIEIFTTPSTYLTQLENYGQWFLIIANFLLIINIMAPKFLPVCVDYSLSILAVLASWVLVLGQFNKHPKLGLYMEMFMLTLNNFGWLFLWFIPILVAFTLGFRMLLPWNKEFHLLPPFGLIKIEAMSTGEYNYNDIYAHEVDVIMWAKNILILAFITTVGIVLANLLIGLVVSDIQGLLDRARVRSLATQLEQLYLMETFITKNLYWWHSLVKACRITENRSCMTVCPLCYLKFLWEGFVTIIKSFWKRILRIPHFIFSRCNFMAKILLPPPEEYSSVPSTDVQLNSESKPHIIQKQMKEFSEECKALLMELKAKRDEMQNKIK